MSPKRLTERHVCPKSETVARLAGHDLRFHKRSVDGTGTTDALTTGIETDTVWGVALELGAGDKSRLDEAEGVLGGHYREEIVRFESLEGRELQAISYTANAHKIDPEMKPSIDYLSHVAHGARHHRVPDDYCTRIEEVETHD